MATTITLKEAGIYFGEKLPKLQRAAALRGLASAAQRGLQLVQAEIIPSRSPQPVDRGVYRAGWRAVKIKDGYAVENLEPHAAFVEYGVRASNVKPGRAMIAALAKGDEVLTNGGLLGRIEYIADSFVTVEIADKVSVKIQKNAITAVLPKGTIKQA